MEHEYTFAGALRGAADRYDEAPTRRAGPNNLWPCDRSWFVYSDYDLWATKVSRSVWLIAALDADPEIETVRLAR